MKSRGRLMFYPIDAGSTPVTTERVRRDLRTYPMLASFMATLKHHEPEALACRALTPSTPIQPSKLLTIQVFDTF
jgi:hypothetical protein